MTPSESLALREDLHALLAAATDDPGLAAEMARARREFFGDEEPDYATDDAARESAAVRFAEWFLLERESDVLADVPVRILGAKHGVDAALAQSRVGVFLVESATRDGSAGTRVRDLQDASRHELRAMPEPVGNGDVLVGRLYEADDGRFVPSSVLMILKRAPHVAVAFQKDLRGLEIERRLSQAELEHLLHRRLGQVDVAFEQQPIERLEARLENLLGDAAETLELDATEVSAQLRAAPTPGAVIGPLLDEIAFHTDLDLDAVRKALLELWNAQRVAEMRDQLLADDAADERSQQQRNAAAPKTKDAAAPPTPPDDRPLGQRLAERIEDGLAAQEDIESMFRDVDAMLGDDAVGDDDDEVTLTPEDAAAVGDLEPLVLEFGWERDLAEPDKAALGAFVRTQLERPVPRANLEYLDVDDLGRYLLQEWLAATHDARAAAIGGRLALLDDFYGWVRDEHDIDCTPTLRDARAAWDDDAERLQRAAVRLRAAAGATLPAARDAEPELLRVADANDERVVLVGDDDESIEVELAGGDLAEGDVLLSGLERSADGTARVVGVAVPVPGAIAHLLG